MHAVEQLSAIKYSIISCGKNKLKEEEKRVL